MEYYEHDGIHRSYDVYEEVMHKIYTTERLEEALYYAYIHRAKELDNAVRLYNPTFNFICVRNPLYVNKTWETIMTDNYWHYQQEWNPVPEDRKYGYYTRVMDYAGMKSTHFTYFVTKPFAINPRKRLIVELNFGYAGTGWEEEVQAEPNLYTRMFQDWACYIYIYNSTFNTTIFETTVPRIWYIDPWFWRIWSTWSTWWRTYGYEVPTISYIDSVQMMFICMYGHLRVIVKDVIIRNGNNEWTSKAYIDDGPNGVGYSKECWSIYHTRQTINASVAERDRAAVDKLSRPTEPYAHPWIDDLSPLVERLTPLRVVLGLACIFIGLFLCSICAMYCGLRRRRYAICAKCSNSPPELAKMV